MSEQQNSQLSNIQNQKIADNFQDTNNQINFTVRTLNSASDHIVGKINEAENKINGFVTNLERCATEQQEFLNKISTESSILFMLPEKIQNMVKAIAPQIAEEVENIHSSKLVEIISKLEQLQQNYQDDASKQQQVLRQASEESLKQLTSTTEQLTNNLISQFTEFADQLASDAELVNSNNQTKYFKKLAVTILFSAIISSGTAYIVTNNFPRFVKIDHSNEVSVHNGTINVFSNLVTDKKKN
jgi:hypothetical protein